MRPIYNAWCCQIELTNFCHLSCAYCSRYNKHLRNDQRYHMTMEFLDKALWSLKDWPSMIGIIGGEPILHPQFEEACALIRSKFPRHKMGLWTSGGPKWKMYHDMVRETFGHLAYNEHSEAQKAVCRHQPLTIAIGEAVQDERLRNELIDDCWVQRTWCPTINPKGAFFCEVAAAIDMLLDGPGGWEVTQDWWKKTPDKFVDQVGKHCNMCGMALPIERELLRSNVEKISPKLLKIFQEHGLRKIEVGTDLEIFDQQLTEEQVKKNAERWYPGNYREDKHADEHSPEGKGFTK